MYNTYYLKNGIRLVYDKMPYFGSVSVGIWVKSGSMYETKHENGISHFIEHMLFKGTEKRSAYKIAEEMDFVGGQINAYTSRECTCYYTKTLSDSLELSLDILSDMYYNSLFSPTDIELERKVIIEEINMYEDSPEDVVLDTLTEYIWENHPLGYLISGTTESVKNITRDMILDYFRRRYTPENTVISVAGGFDEEKLISLCEKYFSGGENTLSSPVAVPVFHSFSRSRVKDIEQLHLSIGYPAFDITNDKIYSLSIMNSILGGSMSSRLFQSVREKHGLCYSIYSYTGILPLAGMFGIYAGLNPSELKTALELIENEIMNFTENGITDYELQKAKGQFKCGIIMSRESVSSKMNTNGKSLLLLDRVRTDDEIISAVDSLTSENIKDCAKKVFMSGEKSIFILKNE